MASRPLALLCLASFSLIVALACNDSKPVPARTLFILGDSYAVASAQYLIPLAQSVQCDAHFANVTKNGWRAEQILEKREPWFPLLEEAPKPVVVYLTIGFNDMLAPGYEKTPEATAAVVNPLLDLIHDAVAPDGGELVLVGYDDLWSLPEHPVYFAGKRSSLRRELSGMFEKYYAALRVRSAAGSDRSRYRFVDVRGWLGEELWTNDGIHMLHENYEAQAKLLWNGEFNEALGCDRVGPDGSSG
ncbi:MAG: SGNH/GDSL hydrolase family protein [Myxococcota bacterium]|nr:SGNH/GDSL hydrolase family protein [Myxococcota bacterium]